MEREDVIARMEQEERELEAQIAAAINAPSEPDPAPAPENAQVDETPETPEHPAAQPDVVDVEAAPEGGDDAGDDDIDDDAAVAQQAELERLREENRKLASKHDVLQGKYNKELPEARRQAKEIAAERDRLAAEATELRALKEAMKDGEFDPSKEFTPEELENADPETMKLMARWYKTGLAKDRAALEQKMQATATRYETELNEVRAEMFRDKVAGSVSDFGKYGSLDGVLNAPEFSEFLGGVNETTGDPWGEILDVADRSRNVGKTVRVIQHFLKAQAETAAATAQAAAPKTPSKKVARQAAPTPVPSGGKPRSGSAQPLDRAAWEKAHGEALAQTFNPATKAQAEQRLNELEAMLARGEVRGLGTPVASAT